MIKNTCLIFLILSTSINLYGSDSSTIVDRHSDNETVNVSSVDLNETLDQSTYHIMLKGSFVAGLGTFMSLMLVKAPYGRYSSQDWGPTLPNKVAWILMELPSVVFFSYCLKSPKGLESTARKLLASLWLSHYSYRTFIFPNLIRSKNKRMPMMIALSGFAYNTLNSYLNGTWIAEHGDYDHWEKDPRFLLGASLFLAGFILNIHSDLTLIKLRSIHETGYSIPYGGGYKFVSAPNYLGEIIEWTGWSIASWSLPALSFALYTSANLVPRALAHHQWYKETFKETYPEDRKAIFPGIL